MPTSLAHTPPLCFNHIVHIVDVWEGGNETIAVRYLTEDESGLEAFEEWNSTEKRKRICPEVHTCRHSALCILCVTVILVVQRSRALVIRKTEDRFT